MDIKSNYYRIKNNPVFIATLVIVMILMLISLGMSGYQFGQWLKIR